MTTLEYARFYLSKGFSVIPIAPRSKQPSIAWREFQERKPTDEEIIKWFRDNNQNIGIVTGKISGLTVVDLDTEGAVLFAKNNGFPLTPLVKTQRGYHAYYAYKEGVRNFQKRDDLPGIDLRSDGGYVIAPPSVHPSGIQYAWVKDKGINELPLAELPEIVLARKPEDKKPLNELYKGVDKGSRNDTLARLTGSWVNDGLSFDECLENAHLWNAKNNPPLDAKEVERTVKSIFEKHQREVSNCPIYISGHSDTLDFKPFCALKKGSELGQLDLTIEWAIDKLLPQQSITLLHGKGGIGKTWLSLIMADAISRGMPFMGLNTKQMPVVFVDFENSLPVVVDRVKKIGIEDVLFWHNSNETLKPPKLDEPNWKLYNQLPAGSLIVFDTLRASQNQDENDSQHMAFIMNRLKELRDKGFTILLLHHAPKGNDRTYKGSTAILDLADHVLSLYKVKKSDPLGGEIEDDDDQNCLYRLGTKDKTRYEPFHIFMSFDEAKGFIKALDPDEECLQDIHEIMQDKGTLNQKQLFEILKNELGIRSKGKAISLLRKGEGRYWNSHREKNAIFYEPLKTVQLSKTPYHMQTLENSQVSEVSEVSTTIYRTDGHFFKNPPNLSKTTRTDAIDDATQSLDDSQVSNCPGGIQTVRTEPIYIDAEVEL